MAKIYYPAANTNIYGKGGLRTPAFIENTSVYNDAPYIPFSLSEVKDSVTGDTGTFTRATTKTYTDTSGDLQLAASGELVHTNIGFVLEPQRTNKCTNYNANPDAGLTNVTLNDLGTGATLTRVDKAAELLAAGLDNICTDGNVYKLVSGTAAAQAVISGATGNTNAHSLSAWVMVESGSTIEIKVSGGIGAVTSTSTTFIKLESANFTPGGVGNTVLIQAAGAGQTVYFILNQLEEGANVSSSIITEGSATTRNADVLSYPSTNLPVNGAFKFDLTLTAAAQGAISLCGAGSASTDRVSIIHDGTNIIIRKRLLSTDYDATKALAYAADTTYTIKGRIDGVNGVDLWIEDVKGTGDANTDAPDFGSALYIGSDYDGSGQMTGGVNNYTWYSGLFTDAEVVAL